MDNRIGSIVMGFVFILIGVVLFQALADEIESASVTGNKPNESIAVTSTSHTVLLHNITIASGIGNTGNISVINITFFGNSTNNTDMPGIAIGVEVNWTIDGVVYVIQGAGTDDIYFTDGAYNISYIYTTDGIAQTSEDDLTAVTYFGNELTNTESTGIAVDSEVNWTVPGVITVETRNFTDATYNITYTYLPDEYVKNATARTLLPITNIFFSIAIMVIGILLVFNGFKDVLRD